MKHQGQQVYWPYGEDRRFDRLYSTASVVTALSQLGLPDNSNLLARGITYLKAANHADLSDRAASTYLLVSGRIADSDALRFVRALRSAQIKDKETDACGSFLLSQGEEGGSLAPESGRTNWTPSKVHSDGASFHACHVADTLLHLPPAHSQSRQAAREVLDGIRYFLTRELSRHEGWLVDLQGRRTPLTVYGLALCNALAVPLPSNWRSIVAETFDLLSTGSYGLVTRCFGILNATYLGRSISDEEYMAAAKAFVGKSLDHLLEMSDLSLLEARDIAAVLRAIVSGFVMFDHRLASVVCSAAVDCVAEYNFTRESA